MPSLQHSSWTPLPRVMAMLRGSKRCGGRAYLWQGVDARLRAPILPCTACCTGQRAVSSPALSAVLPITDPAEMSSRRPFQLLWRS